MLKMTRIKCSLTQMYKLVVLKISQASASIDKVQDQQVASSSSQSNDQSNASNQMQVLQPINVARDHPLDSIIGDISRGVSQDQDWHHFVTLLICVIH